MGKITFVLGGARSGKSRYAVALAKEAKAGKVAFIATCLPIDKEMKARVALHKKTRPGRWQTFEAPQSPSSLLEKIGDKFDLILIDCLTLLVSNLLLKGVKETAVEKEIMRIIAQLKRISAESIIVSNETGLGIVPANKLARNFRDTAGRVNQIVASEARCVFFMVSGIPWKVK